MSKEFDTTPIKEPLYRDRRFQKALAALLIGGGVISGTHLAITHKMHETSSNTIQQKSSYDPTAIPDSWPDTPKYPLPPPKILSPTELQQFVDSQQK